MSVSYLILNCKLLNNCPILLSVYSFKDELSWDFTFPDGSTDKLSDLLLIENGE